MGMVTAWIVFQLGGVSFETEQTSTTLTIHSSNGNRLKFAKVLRREGPFASRQAPADGVYVVGSDLHWGGKLDYRACWRQTAARQAISGSKLTPYGHNVTSPFFI
jgi:hypothetical protein